MIVGPACAMLVLRLVAFDGIGLIAHTAWNRLVKGTLVIIRRFIRRCFPSLLSCRSTLFDLRLLAFVLVSSRFLGLLFVKVEPSLSVCCRTRNV